MQEYSDMSNRPQRDFRDRRFRNYERDHSRKRFGLGLLVLIIGVIVLMKQLGFGDLIPIRHLWPYFLIGLGILIGIKNNFRSPMPIVLIVIGIANVIPSFSFYMGDRLVLSRHLVAPFILIAAGLFFIFVSKKKRNFQSSSMTSNENYLQKDVIFGGAKEVITAKDFSGGDVTAIFGGVEINLVQADSSKDEICINARAIFGGVEVIVPSHWEVKNEMTVALGSVDDQRVIRAQDPDLKRKVLVLKGACVFGGVEIKSF